MLQYFLKRLLSLGLSLVAASVIIFLALEVVPGDPASYMLGLNAQEDTLAALREELGLGGSILERYAAWAVAFWSAISARPTHIARPLQA